ncbi:hypothetical protein MRX96_022396 [Rhipicephalus microplus]
MVVASRKYGEGKSHLRGTVQAPCGLTCALEKLGRSDGTPPTSEPAVAARWWRGSHLTGRARACERTSFLDARPEP